MASEVGEAITADATGSDAAGGEAIAGDRLTPAGWAPASSAPTATVATMPATGSRVLTAGFSLTSASLLRVSYRRRDSNSHEVALSRF